MSGINWIAMAERQPEPGEPVLFYDAVRHWVNVGDLRGETFWTARGLFWDHCADLGVVPAQSVSHWAALNHPPSAKMSG